MGQAWLWQKCCNKGWRTKQRLHHHPSAPRPTTPCLKWAFLYLALCAQMSVSHSGKQRIALSYRQLKDRARLPMHTLFQTLSASIFPRTRLVIVSSIAETWVRLCSAVKVDKAVSTSSCCLLSAFRDPDLGITPTTLSSMSKLDNSLSSQWRLRAKLQSKHHSRFRIKTVLCEVKSRDFLIPLLSATTPNINRYRYILHTNKIQ